MKTGLLTFYHIHHYGAMLQAYATERAVASLGSECEIIDYYVNQDNTLFQRPTGLGSAAHDAHTALHYGPLKARYERFEAFSRENLNISGRRYQSLEELRQAELPYDVLLSGSDQIWNPKIFPDGRFDPVFFGAFSHKRKIAYAPSFGIPRIPDGMEEELRTYLESFSHLSVRERQGQGIVRDITGKDVPVVLDPTLLLERTDWAAAARDGGAGRGYILCYCISRPDALAPYIRRLAEETGLPVVQLCGVRQKVHPKARCILSAGPAEFLGLFRDAAYVCTNSFHGTVFSVQFQKPFFTAVAPAEMAAPESSRTFSLLSRLGLGERIIGKGDTADLTAPIDWAAVGERLGRERKLSLDYLRCALEDRPHTPEEAPVKAEERPLPHLADHTHCTGCTACASGCPKDAITMERDREGFAYPVIDGAACVRCGHCTAVCPVLRERPQSSMPAVFAAWNRNDEIRRDSTSGGVFTLLAEYILENLHGKTFPGWEPERMTKLDELFEAYRPVTKEKLWENLQYFLEAIMPTCHETGIKMAIHQDDPPWDIFGIPRLLCDKESIGRFLHMVDDEYNCLCLCSGSLGANMENNVADIIRTYCDRIAFAHIRNLRHYPNGDFSEVSHRDCDGDTGILEIMRAYHNCGYTGYVRPDHGRHLWGEEAHCRPGYGLYDRALGIMYLWGCWDMLERLDGKI